MFDRSQEVQQTKAARVFAAFMSGGSFNRFEAERELHDHCLHSTVAEIQQRRKIVIARRFETVLGYHGNPTRVCRYWVTPEERARFTGQNKEQFSSKIERDL
ncbi:MAG: hypothetical protein RQ783_08600 [Gammaproteobacteria bacterium]|nr:hypothetical protein [Gammaproteobacteria bacterium]